MAEKISGEKRPTLSDLDLIRRARLEDTSAYEVLIRRYYSQIYELAYGMTSRREDAAELTQEVFVKAWKAMGHFREQACFRAWVYRIALTRVMRFRKKRVVQNQKGDRFEEFDSKVKLSELYHHFSSKGSVLRKMSLSEFQKKMNHALLTLPDKLRSVIVMHDVQGLSCAEIAGILSCSEAAARSQLLHARNKLMSELVDCVSPEAEQAGKDLFGLLSLKRFEHPDEVRIEKNVQTVMQAVRAAHQRPSLLLFPDKSMGWMFAQPRYGIAALFILFLVLHMCKGPVSTIPSSVNVVTQPVSGGEVMTTLKTNAVPALGVPAGLPEYSLKPPLPVEFSSRPVGPIK